MERRNVHPSKVAASLTALVVFLSTDIPEAFVPAASATWPTAALAAPFNPSTAAVLHTDRVGCGAKVTGSSGRNRHARSARHVLFLEP